MRVEPMADEEKTAAPSKRTALKEWVEIVQSLFTIGALIAAGFWFVAQQSLKPEVKIDQTITQRPLAGRPGYWLVAIDVRVTNVGKIQISLTGGLMELTQINPVPGETLLSGKLKDVTLDPGQSDQAIFKTVIVPDYIHTIELDSNYGLWTLMTSADIGDGKPDKTIARPPNKQK
jgi:hypothetical protein